MFRRSATHRGTFTAARLRAEGQVRLAAFPDGVQQIHKQIWAISENGLRGFQTCCEIFPLPRTNVTVNASVCRGLSGHSSSPPPKKTDIHLLSPSHLSIHPPHLKAEQEERCSDNGINTTCTSIFEIESGELCARFCH